MDFMNQDIILFFDQHQTLLPLYEAFAGKMAERFPDTKTKVQKTQITFSNRHVYACISFLRVKKKAELPVSYFVLTLGLPYPLESGRRAVCMGGTGIYVFGEKIRKSNLEGDSTFSPLCR